ncbi:MAG: hypothetical protein ABL907_00610 [Hyphomicrobium sp.]
MRSSNGTGFVAAMAAVLSVALAGADAVLAGPAVNQFEVKNLSNEPGELEFQSQNAHIFGQPRRKFLETTPGNFEYDGNALARQRHALEMEMTLTHFLRTRVGIEYESERLDDPATFADANRFAPLSLTEIAVEGVVILAPVKTQGIGFGALVEYQHPIGDPGEAATLFAGPIIQAKSGAWDFVANLMLVKHLRGGEPGPAHLGRDEKWDFAYATHVQYKFSDAWTFSLEAYGTIDRLGNSGTRSDEAILFGDHDQHRIGPVVYYTFKTAALAGSPAGGAKPGKIKALSGDNGDDDDGASVRVGVGLLFGLNDNTPDHSLKWSVEVEF